MEDLLKVGVITSTHGIRGEVRVFPTTDDPKRFKKLKKVFLDTQGRQLEMEVASVKFSKNMVIVKFKGIDDINEAEKFREAGIYVTREDAVPLGNNEYFIADLIGLLVVSDAGEDIGELADVLRTGANDVYVIKRKGAADLLVPAIFECIKEVDIEAGRMTVHLLPGLGD